MLHLPLWCTDFCSVSRLINTTCNIRIHTRWKFENLFLQQVGLTLWLIRGLKAAEVKHGSLTHTLTHPQCADTQAYTLPNLQACAHMPPCPNDVSLPYCVGKVTNEASVCLAAHSHRHTYTRGQDMEQTARCQQQTVCKLQQQTNNCTVCVQPRLSAGRPGGWLLAPPSVCTSRHRGDNLRGEGHLLSPSPHLPPPLCVCPCVCMCVCVRQASKRVQPGSN